MKTKRFVLMLLVMLTGVMGAFAQMTFIKDVKVQIGEKNGYSVLTSEGYTVISGPGETYFDFNDGTGGDYVYIGYKTTTNPNEAISDLAIVYNDDNTGTSTAYGSKEFLYGGSKTMKIGNKRYYLAPYSGIGENEDPDMNTGNKKHNNCVYLYYTRDVDTSDGMRLLTTLGGERWGSSHTSVPSGWNSMIRGYMGNGQPKTTGGSTYEVTYDAKRVFGDTNEAGGGDYTYILCNYADVDSYYDIDRQKKFLYAVTEITNASSTLNAGWYIVRGQNVQTGTLTCNGAVNIILADGAKLTATGQANNPGIQVSAAGSSLAIYGQTAQSGRLTAIGGTGASAIDGGSTGASSPIYVNTSLVVYADSKNPPATLVDYAIGKDASALLSGKRYATMRKPVNNITVTLDRQGGTGGWSDVIVDEGSRMHTIIVPTRPNYTFQGYYAGQNGTGTKYYNADGTSAHKWDHASTTTLYAHWKANNYTVTFDMLGGEGGSESVTATYDAAMPEITIPTREGCEFLGYFSQPNGTGTKYYNDDGTSACIYNITNHTTLYAYWKCVYAYYIDADGTKKTANELTMITRTSSTIPLSSGWYIINDADVQTGTLICDGAVNLILADCAKLTATGGYGDAGIRVSAEDASLTIYGQENQTGQLIANGGEFASGIGGGDQGNGHHITINGGVIHATGGDFAFGIGGGVGGDGHDITINGGVIHATGGCNASAIGGTRIGHLTSNIYVNSSLILYADDNNPPSTIVSHSSDEDISGSISGKQYAIVRKPIRDITLTFDKQSGTGGTDQVTVNEGSEMPPVSVPTLENYAFVGYFTGPNGTGTQYYNVDGTSAHLWDHTENTTLYAHWSEPVEYMDTDGVSKSTGYNGEITDETTTLIDGWYIVRGNVQTGTIVCEGKVNLILFDDAKLTVRGNEEDAGIRVSAEGASLTIYGQKDQTGQLFAIGGDFGAGIGGGNEGKGHGITINGGVITASGGDGASAIGGRGWGNASDIYVSSSLVLYADDNNPPTTFISHSTDVDVSGFIFSKKYVIVRKPKIIAVTLDKKNGTGDTDQVTVEEGSGMPTISVPARENYGFVGYFAGPNGTGTQYYYADGTSAHLWDHSENTTLYAHWSEPVKYMDADGEEKFTGFNGEITSETTTLNGGWYIVRDEVHTGTLVCEGKVNLILTDGAKLTAIGDDWDAGIQVSAEGASLTIYGQMNQTGQLIAKGGRDGAGIGGADITNGHNITINGGIITASAGDGASAIGSGYWGDASDIYINSLFVLYADNDNPPTTIIRHSTSVDVSKSISGKQYAIVRKPIRNVTVTFGKQGGTGGTGQITVDEGSEMPTVLVPTLENYVFVGYFAEPNGIGTKYYNADGTSAHLWDNTENTTLYAHWSEPVVYMDADGVLKYTGYNAEVTNTTTTLINGWYIVRGNVQTGTIVCEGVVNLILADGAKLTATGGWFDAGIRVSAEGSSLTIYGQGNQTGQLVTRGGDYGAGIGGNYDTMGHNITINGGIIKASGGGYASAIGASDININAPLILKADNNEEPTIEIEHTSTDDLASALSDKKYVTIALPSVAVNKVPDQDVSFGTFYHKYADYVVPNEDATIYTASVEDVQGETCLVLHKIEGNVIPANTAVILRTDESSTINLQPCADASDVDVPANSLSGANLPMDAPANCYIMSYGQNGLGFYKYKYAEGNTLAAHKAYLVYEKPAGAKGLKMVFDDNDVTGIENINDDDTLRYDNDNIYNLNGIRLNKLQKGINIVGGKKIVVK